MADRSNVWLQGSTALSPAMQDVMRGNEAYYERNLASLGEQFQQEQVQSVARLGAERLAQYGPEGERWAQALATDPYAAYALAESMGGFGEIEGRLAAARAQGAASEALGQMQQAGASPQEIVGFILRTQGPEAAKQAADALGVGQSVTPKAVIDPKTGQPIYVSAADAIGKQPVPRAPLVSIGGEGLNPYQSAQMRAQILDDHRTESEPYVGAAARLNELDGILAELEGEPTPFQSEAAATAFAKGLKPAEAVMRDDIARILGQGVANQIKGFLNLPQKASRAQIIQMREALAQVVSVAEMRQREIDAKYRGLGSDYEVEIPESARTTPPPSVRSAPPSMDELLSMPVGATFTDSEGTWRKTNRTAPNGDPIFEEVE